jgi:hypothetical protein
MVEKNNIRTIKENSKIAAITGDKLLARFPNKRNNMLTFSRK